MYGVNIFISFSPSPELSHFVPGVGTVAEKSTAVNCEQAGYQFKQWSSFAGTQAWREAIINNGASKKIALWNTNKNLFLLAKRLDHLLKESWCWKTSIHGALNLHYRPFLQSAAGISPPVSPQHVTNA